jgi:hypothetical protein
MASTVAKAAPVSIHVGKAVITDKVEVQAARLPEVRLAVGQPLHLEVPYDSHETSREREQFTFGLQCTVAESFSAKTPTYRDPVIDSWGDRRGRQDDHVGLLRDAIVFAKAGQYAIEYTIRAERTVAPWAEARIAHRDERKVSGLVHVTVA